MFVQPTASPLGCISEINPAELETFHLAYRVMDAGYSASAAVLLLILSRIDGWHSSSKKNIVVRRSPFPSCDKQSKHAVGQLMLNGMVYSCNLSDIMILLRTVAQDHK